MFSGFLRRFATFVCFSKVCEFVVFHTYRLVFLPCYPVSADLRFMTVRFRNGWSM